MTDIDRIPLVACFFLDVALDALCFFSSVVWCSAFLFTPGTRIRLIWLVAALMELDNAFEVATGIFPVISLTSVWT